MISFSKKDANIIPFGSKTPGEKAQYDRFPYDLKGNWKLLLADILLYYPYYF